MASSMGTALRIESRGAREHEGVQQCLTVFWWAPPTGHKVHIILEGAGLPYRVIPVNIGAGEQFEADFLAISPNNKIPAIVDPDGPEGKPLTLFESGAILL